MGFLRRHYFLRMLVTMFALLRRHIRWPEAITLALLAIALQLGFAGTGTKNPYLAAWSLPLGLLLYGVGSTLNSGSEWLRERFVASRRGTLFTHGPYTVVRHPNYLGDVLLFVGWALVVGQVWR